MLMLILYNNVFSHLNNMYLNTSNVNVNQSIQKQIEDIIINLNTSNVNVNL